MSWDYKKPTHQKIKKEVTKMLEYLGIIKIKNKTIQMWIDKNDIVNSIVMIKFNKKFVRYFITQEIIDFLEKNKII